MYLADEINYCVGCMTVPLSELIRKSKMETMRGFIDSSGWTVISAEHNLLELPTMYDSAPCDHSCGRRFLFSRYHSVLLLNDFSFLHIYPPESPQVVLDP
jgi:hypothetical protein